MELFEYDNNLDERINSYKCNFFHMYLDGKCPINNEGNFNKVPTRDYASFVHEYVHYLQQITTPYGLKYSNFFNNKYLLFREHISALDEVVIPIVIDEVIDPAEKVKKELGLKNGCKSFSRGTVSDIEIYKHDILLAKELDTAVNIGVYDFENNRAFEKGFQFGYWCIIESMAHLVQSLINPELYHTKVPYESAQLVCAKYRPDLKDDKRLLISVCYVALYFPNPGYAFFEILDSIPINGENGMGVYRRYMRDYARNYNGQSMPNYRMMHNMIDNFVHKLGALVGDQLVYYKGVFDSCKREASLGESFFLDILYNNDIGSIEGLCELLNFYGHPAIDSHDNSLIAPRNFTTGEFYIENASLISLELMITRFEGKDNIQTCIRYPICKQNRESNSVEIYCRDYQWLKENACLFKSGLHYWQWEDKIFISDE